MAVEIHIWSGTLRIRRIGCDEEMLLADWISLEGRRVFEIGKPPEDVAVPVGRTVVTARATDPAGFDADVAQAMIRYAVAKGAALGRTGWRAAFLGPGRIDLIWPDWPRLSPDARRRFIAGFRRIRLTINERQIVAPRVDLPLLRGLFGMRVSSDP